MNALNPVLKIRDQVLDGLVDHDVAPPRREREPFVADLLGSVGLPAEVADRFPHQLSGGMKQRACIAIAIAMKPRLIIADEPTSALDVITQRQVMDTLCRVQETIGCGLVLIGHDMGLMAQVANRMIVMQDGRIVEDAPVRSLFRRPQHAYSRMLIESVPSLGAPPPAAAAPPLEAAEAAQGEPLLELDGVGKEFGGGLFRRTRTIALEPCSFRLDGARPSIVAVVGQSGSGKTTLARMILGFERPTHGRVLYRGTSIADLRGAEALRYRREVQAIFQDPTGPSTRSTRSTTCWGSRSRCSASPAGATRFGSGSPRAAWPSASIRRRSSAASPTSCRVGSASG